MQILKTLFNKILNKIEKFLNNANHFHYLGISIVAILLLFFIGINIYSVVVCTENVQATVRYVSYSYYDDEGKEAFITYSYNEQEYEGIFLSSYYKKGDTLTIRVNPNNPSHFIQDPFTYFVQNVLVILIFVVTIIVISYLIKRRY